MKCGKARSSGTDHSSKARSNDNALLHQTGDWICSKCQAANFKDRFECRSCKTSKVETNDQWFRTQFVFTPPIQAENAGNNAKAGKRAQKSRADRKDWICHSCSFKNFGSRKQCKNCEAKKVETAPPAQTQSNADEKDETDKLEFANNCFGHVAAGGNVQKIEIGADNNDGYALMVSWHVGVSKGVGEALFEGDGSALLAAEKLKEVTFGANKLRIRDPVKCEAKPAGVDSDNLYKIELSNLPSNFDDEVLTRSLAKLNLENFIEARVFFRTASYPQATDSALASVSLTSLLMPYSVKDIKMHPAKFGVCRAIVKLSSMSDCLRAINELNSKHIEFGVRGGKLSVQLDLRIIIELEQFIYDVLRPEVEKLMYLIRRNPSKFFGVKVFLFGMNRSASNKARIVLVGSDSDAILLARDLYEHLTKPLIIKCQDRYKCTLLAKFLQQPQFANFKCCLVHVLSDMDTIKVYASSATRKEVESAAQSLEKEIIYHEVKVTPSFIRYLRQTAQQDTLRQFEQSQVYVKMDVAKQLVHVVYRDTAKSSSDVEMKNNDEVDNDNDAESAAKGKECIEWIERLLSEQNASEVTGSSNDKNEDNEMSQCGVCFMEIEANETFYVLKGCQHSFHSDCIAMQLNAACQPTGTRPVLCATCNANICLSDVQHILESQEKYKQLLSLSITNYIDTHPNQFKHCPTPDCVMIYSVAARNQGNEQAADEEKKQAAEADTGDEHIFNCTQCMKQYCLKCDVPYHFGLSCDAYELSKDADKSLSAFLSQYNADAKTQKCPSCGTITDKLPNTCNHATCVYCKAHFCWKCLWMDQTNNKQGALVYAHMRSAHGSFYG